jgi:hypothetical protein
VANIDRIVKVQIALRTAGVRQVTFSDLLLLGVHTGPNRVDIITEADTLLVAPFSLATTDDLYLAAQVAFSQIPGPTRIFIGRRGVGEAVNVALAACAVANDGWYGFTDVSHTEADLLLAAAWAEANTKLFLTALSDVDILASSGAEPATALMTSNFFRTAWWYNADPNQFPEVAAAARAFTILPGGETWANMRLQAVTAPPLTETAYTNITAKNGNSFEPFRNLALTQNGITAGGEWIDVIRFRDWLVEEIRTSVFNKFVDARIPYTDPGIAIIRQGLIQALDLGVRRGGIAPRTKDPNSDTIIPSYTTSVPWAADVSTSDKAARILRDVAFTARLAGAIHAVEIAGTLTYDAIG